jgi:hypothetical protein
LGFWDVSPLDANVVFSWLLLSFWALPSARVALPLWLCDFGVQPMFAPNPPEPMLVPNE